MQTEAQARLYINKSLTDSGWRLVDAKGEKANVLVEYKTESTDHRQKGFADYILLDPDGFPLAVIEAKAPDKHPLVGKEQAREYAESQNIEETIEKVW